MMTHRASWQERVAEFLGALGRRHTWSVRENTYLVFGFLWGLPVPAMALAIDLSVTGRPLSDAGRCLAEHPMQLVFLLHPLLFAIVFGALGTMARNRDERIRELVARLSDEARTDGLTGLLNHRAFYEVLHVEVERAKRQRTGLACLIVDVDHFKLVNDRWGHLAGDRVLQGIASRLTRASRPYDVVARYGGEEISILLPGSGAEEARAQAERLRRAIETEPFDVGQDTPELCVTVSVGVALFGTHAEDGSRLVGAADHAMYAAKRAGRNRVCLASLSATTVCRAPGVEE